MVLRRLHAGAAALFVAAIVVQVVLAGLALANLGGSGDFSSHIEFGYTWVGIACFAVLVTALLARRPRRDVLISLGLLLQYIVQTLLPAARTSLPFLAALHPLNAMLLFGVATWYARREWQAAAMPSLVGASRRPVDAEAGAPAASRS